MAFSIKIAARLRPFSHLPKTRCLIPGTDTLVEAYPARVVLKDFGGKVLKDITLDVEGPLKDFTVLQDLERGCVTIFSESYRFHILPNGEITYAKNPGLSPLEMQERLSLGSHKKQDWTGIRRRLDFCEIFPLWFRLGTLLDLPERKEADEGIFTLINGCKEAIDAHRPEAVIPAFAKLFLAGFEGMFVPRLVDEDFQGILPPDTPLASSSPLYLLAEGAKLIRSLFLVDSDRGAAILPNLPPELFAGRMCNLMCSSYGELDLEWSKKMIRRLVFRAKKDGEILFHFHSSIKCYRVRLNLRDKGSILTAGELLEMKSGKTYLLDQFEK